jgi:arsenate reductase
MAEGWAKQLISDAAVYSAGSKPRGSIDVLAIEVMKEVGVDISQQKSKGFSELPIRIFDYVITMGCKDSCPFLPAKKSLSWDIPDPAGRYIEFYREVRDMIQNKVQILAKQIKQNGTKD